MMTDWKPEDLTEFTSLIKKQRDALNECEHLMRLVRDQSEPLVNVQARLKELLETVGETAARLQKFL